MGKAKKPKQGRLQTATPFGDELLQDDLAKPSTRKKIRNRQQGSENVIDSKLSRKILSEARKQQDDVENDVSGDTPTKSLYRLCDDSESDEEKDEPFSEFHEMEDFVINDEDEKAIQQFMTTDPVKQKTLADVIKEKLTEKQTEINEEFSEVNSIMVADLDDRIVELYQGVKDVLNKYRSGKLPKAFKMIPKLTNWEQILYLTAPERWSAAAMYQATRIFTANLKEDMAQRFFNLVLLPRVRDDISYYQKLNYHIYQALFKALFKPGAFFKGFLLPLCESGTCSLREAIIIGSALAKNSIPVLHSSAAMIKIAEMDYSGANSIFLRIFFDKKYGLPYRVIDAVVYHFLRFENDSRVLPVLWHQALLTFVQRYKEDISAEQKYALLELCKTQNHYQITDEVRRELIQSKSRGDGNIMDVS